MNNRIALKIFTESLDELISENFTLYQSLRIISESKLSNTKVRKTALYLANEIEDGSLFSNALKSCPFIDFDKTYVSFTSFSEKTGNLKNIIRFLKDRCARQDENISTFKSALVYPMFVICLTIFLFVMFIFSSGNFWGSEGIFGISKFEAVKKIGFSFFITGIVSVMLVLFFKKMIGENKIYEAFLSGGFLVKEGINMSVAVGMAAMVSGVDTKLGEVFEKARERIEFGMDIRTAFCGENQSKSFWKRKLGEEIERSLLFAEKTGNKNEVLLKIASYIKKGDDRNRKIYLLMVEPSFIVLLGVFLLNIVIQIFLPVFSNFGIM